MKVVANTEALLALVELEPEFVSQNEHDARLECDVIFPLGYVSLSEEEMEAELKLDGLLPEDEEDGEENKGTEEGEVEEDGKAKEEGAGENTAENVDEEKVENVENEAAGSEVVDDDTKSVENNAIEKSNAE